MNRRDALKRTFWASLAIATGGIAKIADVAAKQMAESKTAPQIAATGKAEEYISCLDIEKPEIFDELYNRMDDQWKGSFTEIMKMHGFERAGEPTAFHYYEDDNYLR